MMEAEYTPESVWKRILEEAIAKTNKIMEGNPEIKFSAEEYQRFHQSVYELSVVSGSSGNQLWVYERFKKSLEESIISTVLPSLVDKYNAPLLRELILMWSNYKLMSKWLCRFFEYLDRCYIPQKARLGSLNDISIKFFGDLVFKELYFKFRAAAISLINQERMGLCIDRDLLKNVFLVFMEIYERRGVNYYEDFEKAMLEETTTYYSQLAPQWLLYDSLKDYIQKVCWCLNQENERASYYLPSSTGFKLLKVVRCQLLEQPANKLIEKQKAESCGLVTDYQEMLSKWANMTLEEGSDASTTGE